MKEAFFIFFGVLFVAGLIWIPYDIIKQNRHRHKVTSEFEALYKRVEDSKDLDRAALIELHDEIVTWYKTNKLFWRNVSDMIIYLRGRLGVSYVPKK